MLLQFIIALGLLVLFHEGGHFLAGLLFKFKIEEFGIGYPPRLVKLFTKNGIDYTLNWIPFGGFTRFKGENDPQAQDGFYQQNKWKRLGVLLAGPIMNLLIGILLFTLVFTNTGRAITDQVIIQTVEADTPAAAAGLMPGDRILRINETPVNSMETISNIVADNLGKPISLVIERNGTEITLQVTPRKEYPSTQGPLGVVMTYPVEPLSFSESVSSALQLARYEGEELISLPGQLISGKVKAEDVRLVSPKGMYDIYAQVMTEEKADEASTKAQLLNILWFFGIISVALGYSNLLPIPGMDGGHILFLLPELIINKKVPEKYESMINMIGMSILIMLMAWAFFQDIVNPIVLP